MEGGRTDRIHGIRREQVLGGSGEHLDVVSAGDVEQRGPDEVEVLLESAIPNVDRPWSPKVPSASVEVDFVSSSGCLSLSVGCNFCHD